MAILRRILILAVFIGLMVLGWRIADSNGTPVTVNYLAGEFVDVALWMVLLASFSAGFVVMGLWALLARARQGLVARRYRKTVAGLEAEVHQLRNLPLSPDAPAPAPAPAPEVPELAEVAPAAGEAAVAGSS